MLYGLKIAWRYLTASKAQSALLIAGVAVGVFVFVFMSGLIGGLASYLVLRTVGDISHVTLTAPLREAGLLTSQEQTALWVQQRATGQRDMIRTAETFVPEIQAVAGVKAVSPQIIGNGIAQRGEARAALAVTGVDPDRISAITDFQGRMVAGGTVLTSSSVLIGQGLAEDLGLGLGQMLRLRSDRDQERSLMITGIFAVGVEALDKRAAFVSLSTARSLFDMPQGVSRIEVKLDDLYTAERMAPRLAALTGYKATPWMEGNAQLLQGLTAQANSGNLIKGFALVTIVIGVASALLLSTYRRAPEIGIMRAFGASRAFVVGVFVVQGALIGLLGGLCGAGLGYGLLSLFPVPEAGRETGFPMDYRQGAYGVAILLTTAGAILAAILPARAAAKIDPVEVIGQ